MKRWNATVRVYFVGGASRDEPLEVEAHGEAGARFQVVSDARRQFPGSRRVEVLSIEPGR
jgi:hypothetical protein